MNAKKKEAFAGPECGNCTATKTKAGQPLTQTCNRCKLVSYCSRECQVQHWKSGDHQKFCLTLKERSAHSALVNMEEQGTDEELFGDEASCPVCLEPIVPAKTDLNVTLPCLHVFHISCVEDLRTHSLLHACPLCRAELPSHSDALATKRCANCGNEKCSNGAPLVNCANCKLVLYCGRDCQRTHWKNGGHKAICARLTTQRIMAELNEPFGPLGTTQLLNAVLSNDIATVRQLLDQGAAVDQGRTHDGVTPLFAAACNGHAEVASLLISSGAAVNQATMDIGATPLSAAAGQGHTEVASLLISSGAAVNQATIDNGATPLFFAAGQGHTEVVSLLISNGAALDQARADTGVAPLFVAVQLGHTEVVTLLVEHGADTNQCILPAGWSPLFVAAWSGRTEVVRILLAAGADKAVATTSMHLDVEGDCTPLSIAVRLGHSEVSRLLSG